MRIDKNMHEDDNYEPWRSKKLYRNLVNDGRKDKKKQHFGHFQC